CAVKKAARYSSISAGHAAGGGALATVGTGDRWQPATKAATRIVTTTTAAGGRERACAGIRESPEVTYEKCVSGSRKKTRRGSDLDASRGADPAIEGPQQSSVTVVHITLEHGPSIRVLVGSPVHQKYRHLTLQGHGARPGRIDRGADGGRVPSDRVAEQQLDELERAVDPNAAGAEGAVVLVKQRARRRVVQVHQVRIREVDLDPAECVVIARGLTQDVRKTARRVLRPCDRGRINRAAAAI